MAFFMRLLAALEIILFLRKLREQNDSIATSNFQRTDINSNEVPKEREATREGHAQIGKEQ
jgi:hypothetical protein